MEERRSAQESGSCSENFGRARKGIPRSLDWVGLCGGEHAVP